MADELLDDGTADPAAPESDPTCCPAPLTSSVAPAAIVTFVVAGSGANDVPVPANSAATCAADSARP